MFTRSSKTKKRVVNTTAHSSIKPEPKNDKVLAKKITITKPDSGLKIETIGEKKEEDE